MEVGVEAEVDLMVSIDQHGTMDGTMMKERMKVEVGVEVDFMVRIDQRGVGG